jgi:hypothetical protein
MSKCVKKLRKIRYTLEIKARSNRKGLESTERDGKSKKERIVKQLKEVREARERLARSK